MGGPERKQGNPSPLISPRALGEHSVDAANVLSVYLLILRLTKQGSQQGEKGGSRNAGALRASESTQGQHLVLHKETQACRGSGLVGGCVVKLGRSWAWTQMPSPALSNFLCPLRTQGPEKPRHRKVGGRSSRMGLESKS